MTRLTATVSISADKPPYMAFVMSPPTHLYAPPPIPLRHTFSIPPSHPTTSQTNFAHPPNLVVGQIYFPSRPYSQKSQHPITHRVSTMPATTPQQPNHLTPRPQSKGTHGAIIVGVLIGVLGIIAVVLFAWDRLRKRGVKKGLSDRAVAGASGRGCEIDEKEGQLETGVIREPLPVYRRELRVEERRL